MGFMAIANLLLLLKYKAGRNQKSLIRKYYVRTVVACFVLDVAAIVLVNMKGHLVIALAGFAFGAQMLLWLLIPCGLKRFNKEPLRTVRQLAMVVIGGLSLFNGLLRLTLIP